MGHMKQQVPLVDSGCSCIVLALCFTSEVSRSAGVNGAVATFTPQLPPMSGVTASVVGGESGARLCVE